MRSISLKLGKRVFCRLEGVFSVGALLGIKPREQRRHGLLTADSSLTFCIYIAPIKHELDVLDRLYIQDYKRSRKNDFGICLIVETRMIGLAL